MAPGAVGQPEAGFRWDLLETQVAPTGERLTVRLAAPDRRDDVFIAVDGAQRRFVLVCIPSDEPHELAERISRGIAVQSVEMNVGGGQFAKFVEIACLETQGHAALDVVVTELVAALEAGASIGRVRLVQNVLAKWRRFWAGVSQGLLTKEQQLGLFGELWFLSRWLSPSIGASNAVQMWRGPVGARNDFEVSGLGIEVKTTGRLDAAHVIHGLEQLMEPPGGALLLFSLSVRDEASGLVTLPKLVQEARASFADDYVTLSAFDSMLYVAGYDDRHAGEYGGLQLRIRAEGLFRVNDGFPRLVPSSFVDGPPKGIDTVSYELRLDAAASWMLAATPAAASALLVDFTGLRGECRT